LVLKLLYVNSAQEKLYESATGLTTITSSAPLAASVGRRLLVSFACVGQQVVEKAAPNAVAISRVTVAPIDQRECEALIPLLSKLRWIASARLTVVMVELNAAT
jgi:iron-sulfur cluster repair protein YtfE (RIC family)